MISLLYNILYILAATHLLQIIISVLRGTGLGALAVSEVSPLSSPLSSSLDVNSSSDGAVIVDATLSDVDVVRFDSLCCENNE